MRQSSNGAPLAQNGFGLIEAVVALTILATAGAALYAWMGGNIRAASQLAETQARARLQKQVIEALDAINPAEQGRGRRRFGTVEVSWRSQLVSPLRVAIPRGDNARWRVGLYRVQLIAQDVESGIELPLETLHTGLLPLEAASPAVADAP